MPNICILDEDPRNAEHIKSLLANHPAANQFSISLFASARKLNELTGADEPVHILIHNIVSPDNLASIQSIKEYFPKESGTQVIYMSEHLEASLDVYEPDRVHFLLKPVSQEKFNQTLDCTLKDLESVPVAQCALRIRTKGQVFRVIPANIHYIESDLRRLHIHVAGKILDTYCQLDEIAAQLPDTFLRCHQSFLVNEAFIASCTRDSITLVDGQIIPVSKSRRRETWGTLQRLSNTTSNG